MADQNMQCPQCGGELVILNDGKRQCPGCGKTYMLMTRARSAGMSVAENGEPITDQHNQCPQCGGELVMLSNGRRQCQNCKKTYMLVPYSVSGRTVLSGGAPVAGPSAARKKTAARTSGTAGKKTKKKSSGAVIAVIVAVVLLLAAVGGFFAYRFFFGEDEGLENVSSSDTGQLAAKTPLTEAAVPMVSTGEIAEGAELKKGEFLKAMGIVEEVGDDFVRLNNGVSCYFDPNLMGEVQAVLGNIVAGDVVGITGLVSDPSSASFTLESCGVPYIYYDGQKYYDEYEDFRKGIPYPDTVYLEEEYRSIHEWWGEYWSALQVMNSFKDNGVLTEESFCYGVQQHLGEERTVRGFVTMVAEDYFVVNDIFCFYQPEVLTDEQLETIRGLKVNDSVSVFGYVCNSSLDAFRMKYCYVRSHTPGDAFTVTDLLGNWDDTVSRRCNLTVDQIDSETISVEIGWSSSAFDSTSWKMTAKYDPERRVLEYADCVQSRSYQAEDGSTVEDIIYESGSGYFYIRDGFLYWIDDEEAIRDGCAFMNYAKDPDRAAPIDYVSLPLDEQIAYLGSVLGDGDYYLLEHAKELDEFASIRDAYFTAFAEHGVNDIGWALYADGTVRELLVAAGVGERLN